MKSTTRYEQKPLPPDEAERLQYEWKRAVNAKPEYKCDYCGRQFYSRAYYLSHLGRHKERKT